MNDELNERQLEAVECLEGPVLILAGAGSGKTKTLTHRIANLIAHGVQPANILAVTFTNKAANEMRERLANILGGQTQTKYFMPYMGTFHGIAVKILRIEADVLGLSRNFVIYDADDQISLIRRVMRELKLTDNKNLKPKTIRSIISGEKNQGNGPEEYEAKAFYPNQKQIAKVFYRYEEEKRQAGALDFDDLLLCELDLLKNHPEVRAKWQNKFEHILIDEYQDTNTVQYNIVKLLVNEKRNICVVGDDWQSIYSWRGADFTNILNFERDFPGAKVIKLEQNYRSTGNILAASQKIIQENETRTDKTLYTEVGEGEPVKIESLQDEAAEANYVALSILNLQREYPDYSNFAVLYRTNAQSYAFEKAFIGMQIPYKIVGGVRFYDRKEVKDVLAILRLVVNQRDKVSLARVCNNVLSGVGEVSLGKILIAMDNVAGEVPLLQPDLTEVLRSAKARNGWARLVNFLRKVGSRGIVADNVATESNASDIAAKNTSAGVLMGPGEIVRQAVEYFDFKSLTDDGTPSGDERMANLEVLAANAELYESLDEFLADASLMSAADETAGQAAVTLMTLHAAKGLEFPVVYIVGLEEGLFPSGRVAEDQAGLEEERRLMYVGMTRAMQRLLLTYALSRYNYGSRNYNTPSRFLMELGYKPYGMLGGETGNGFGVGSAGYHDQDADGFIDVDTGEDGFDFFPEDLPVFE